VDGKIINSRWSSKSSHARLEISKTAGGEQCRVRFGNGFEQQRNTHISEEFKIAQKKLQDMVACLTKADQSGAESVDSEYNAQWSSLRKSSRGEKITVSATCRSI
jgi:hypothetical protein